MAMKPHSKFPISSAKSHVGMLFKDISPSPHESELRFHLIQFSSTNRSDTVIQGFLPSGSVYRYLPHMKSGEVNRHQFLRIQKQRGISAGQLSFAKLAKRCSFEVFLAFDPIATSELTNRQNSLRSQPPHYYLCAKTKSARSLNTYNHDHCLSKFSFCY
ncbi:hypothetical protein YC2023_109994 [Brassica napus]